jgi:hypothetical protein
MLKRFYFIFLNICYDKIFLFYFLIFFMLEYFYFIFLNILT